MSNDLSPSEKIRQEIGKPLFESWLLEPEFSEPEADHTFKHMMTTDFKNT